MTNDEIRANVTKVLVEYLGCKEDKVLPDANLVNDLGADSLDSVEIIMALEEEFGIEIPDEEAETMTTVQAIVDGVQKALEDK